MDRLAESVLNIARDIHNEIPQYLQPPDEGLKPETDKVIPFSYVRGTRGYIEQVVMQINGCYEKGWWDACAVMMRRLCEILIIAAFEARSISGKIKDGSGNYLMLDDLVDRTISEPSWTLNRNTKRILPKLTSKGNISAHGVRYNAHFKDIDPLVDDFRVAVQDFLFLAGLKK